MLRPLATFSSVFMLLGMAFLTHPAFAQEDKQGVEPDEQPWILNIRIDSLKGTELVVNGAVYYSDGTTPAKFAKVHVHQTGADGYYSEGGMDVDNSRYMGEVKTNDKGHFILETVVPGHYNYGRRARHIHFNITPQNGDTEEFVLYFEDDPYMKQPYLDISEKLAEQYGPEASQVRPIEEDVIGDYRCKRWFILKQPPPAGQKE